MIAYLYEFKKNKGPHLIVAPKSIVGNWIKEFAKWTPFIKTVNLVPTKEFRDEILQN